MSRCGLQLKTGNADQGSGEETITQKLLFLHKAWWCELFFFLDEPIFLLTLLYDLRLFS